MEPITVNIKGSSFIEEGKSVDFICSASSNMAAVNVTWYDSNDKLLVSSSTRVTLTRESITRNHSGIYTCKARAVGFPEIKMRSVKVKVVCKWFSLLFFFHFFIFISFCFVCSKWFLSFTLNIRLSLHKNLILQTFANLKVW